MSEHATVHVKNIASGTTEKEVRDFFSFCGKIVSISVTPISGEANAPKSASVTFEKDAAARTALLLDQTQLGASVVQVQAAPGFDDLAASKEADAAAEASKSEDHHEFDQEDKPRSRIVAEYLAHGYALSDTAVQRAISLDQKHGFSNKFTSALSNFDKKFQASDKARGLDQNYKITDKAWGGWHSLNSYFEKALGTPSGQKLRSFYSQTDKQVREVHNEARRLADLKSGKGEAGAGAGAAGAAGATGTADAAGAGAQTGAPAATGAVPTESTGAAAPTEPKA